MPVTGNKALSLFLVLISGSTILLIDFVYADEINPGLYSTESEPFGTSFGDWTAAWWQWVHNVPPDQNVNFDKTGEFCNIGQEGPVWFLGPSFGGKYERSCAIPAGKAILFPINTGECDYISSPDAKTPDDLYDCASENNKGGAMRASINNVPLKNLEKYEVRSPLFNITIPEDNVFGSPPGSSGAVADGYWAFLEPLPAGKHKINFAECP